jgi:hypothetical protein
MDGEMTSLSIKVVIEPNTPVSGLMTIVGGPVIFDQKELL